MIVDTTLLDTIEQASDQEAWEMAVSLGIAAGDGEDGSRWLLGDLALTVQKRYGEDTLGSFSKAIKAEVATLREYRAVCAFWDRKNSARTEFLEAYSNVRYSHFRQAARFKAMDTAERFIRKVADRDWTVERSRIFVDRCLCKPSPAKKLLDKQVILGNPKALTAQFPLTPEEDVRLMDSFGRRKLRIQIHEVRDGDDTQS